VASRTPGPGTPPPLTMVCWVRRRGTLATLDGRVKLAPPGTVPQWGAAVLEGAARPCRTGGSRVMALVSVAVLRLVALVARCSPLLAAPRAVVRRREAPRAEAL